MRKESVTRRKKERKPFIVTGHYLNEDGQKIMVDPKNSPQWLANKCAAFIKTIETGIPHTVVKDEEEINDKTYRSGKTR